MIAVVGDLVLAPWKSRYPRLRCPVMVREPCRNRFIPKWSPYPDLRRVFRLTRTAHHCICFRGEGGRGDPIAQPSPGYYRVNVTPATGWRFTGFNLSHRQPGLSRAVNLRYFGSFASQAIHGDGEMEQVAGVEPVPSDLGTVGDHQRSLTCILVCRGIPFSLVLRGHGHGTVVEPAGFEPTISVTPRQRDTRLRYDSKVAEGEGVEPSQSVSRTDRLAVGIPSMVRAAGVAPATFRVRGGHAPTRTLPG